MVTNHILGATQQSPAISHVATMYTKSEQSKTGMQGGRI
jgi:hypothetical protein